MTNYVDPCGDFSCSTNWILNPAGTITGGELVIDGTDNGQWIDYTKGADTIPSGVSTVYYSYEVIEYTGGDAHLYIAGNYYPSGLATSVGIHTGFATVSDREYPFSIRTNGWAGKIDNAYVGDVPPDLGNFIDPCGDMSCSTNWELNPAATIADGAMTIDGTNNGQWVQYTKGVNTIPSGVSLVYYSYEVIEYNGGQADLYIAGTNFTSPGLAQSVGVHTGSVSVSDREFPFSIRTNGYDGKIDNVYVGNVPPPSGNTITGSGSGTAATATGSGIGQRVITGSGGGTAANATGSGTGTVGSTITGSGSATAETATGSGTGHRVITGSGGGTAETATGAGSGTVSGTITGSGAGTADNATGSGTGFRVISGSGNSQAEPSTGSGNGFRVISGSGSATAEAATGSGTGTVGSTVTGSGAGTAEGATGSGIGQRVVTGFGGGTAESATGSGVGTSSKTVTGSGSGTASDAIGAGIGFRVIVGGGGGMADRATGTGSDVVYIDIESTKIYAGSLDPDVYGEYIDEKIYA